MSALSLSPRPESTIVVSVRECRIVVERVLIAAGLPLGAVPPIRDVAVDAEILGLGALAHLHGDWVQLCGAGAAPVEYRETAPGLLAIDGGNRSSLIVAPDILDLAVAFAHREGTAVLQISNVVRPDLLMALAASAHLYGVTLGIFPAAAAGSYAINTGRASGDALLLPASPPTPAAAASTACLVLCVPAASADAADERVTRAGGATILGALRDGLTVETELWWALYHKANEALTPDSELSRRHTGSSAFDVHGNVVGELGEDYDDVPGQAAGGANGAHPAGVEGRHDR